MWKLQIPNSNHIGCDYDNGSQLWIQVCNPNFVSRVKNKLTGWSILDLCIHAHDSIPVI